MSRRHGPVSSASQAAPAIIQRVHHTQLHFFNSKKIRKLLRLQLKLQNLKDTYLLDISYLNNRELLIGPVKNTEGK